MLYNTYYYVLLHICIILLYVLRVFIFIIFLWKMWPFSRFVASILKRTLQSIKQVIFESSTYTVSWILGKNLHRRDYVSRGMCRCPLWKRWWLAISHRGILIEGSGLTFETMSDHLTVYRLGICGSGWQCSAHYGRYTRDCHLRQLLRHFRHEAVRSDLFEVSFVTVTSCWLTASFTSFACRLLLDCFLITERHLWFNR